MKKEYRHYFAKSAMRTGKLPSCGNVTLLQSAVVLFDNLGMDALSYMVQNEETIWSYLTPEVKSLLTNTRSGSLALKAYMGVDPLELGELLIEVVAEARPEVAAILTPEWVAANYIEFLQEPET